MTSIWGSDEGLRHIGSAAHRLSRFRMDDGQTGRNSQVLVNALTGQAHCPTQKHVRLLKKSAPILLAVTSPCCATEHGEEEVADDGSANAYRVVVLLLPLRRTDSRRSPVASHGSPH